MRNNVSDLARLKKEHRQRQAAIRSRLLDFAAVKPENYFYELIYCLLTPQSSAVHAERTVDELRTRGFADTGFDPEFLLREKAHYVRFHRTKAKRLLKVRTDFPEIRNALSNGASASAMRDWLAANVKGLGYKEATHFLRNIGKNGGLAILDRHILRNLKRFGVIRTLPVTLTKKKYLAIEKRFQRFAEKTGIPLDELDLLFWSMETGEVRK